MAPTRRLLNTARLAALLKGVLSESALLVAHARVLSLRSTTRLTAANQCHVVNVQGIKVKDADSKKKVRKLLAQEQAMKMAIDDEPQVNQPCVKWSMSKKRDGVMSSKCQYDK